MGSVTTIPVGAAAEDFLAGRLHDLRGGQVLAPARVLCPTPTMAIGLRRSLGRRPGGIAGVTVETLGQFAASLAQPEMAAGGLRRARRSELVAAIRAELRVNPGQFGPVADHRTTEDRLVAFHHQLVGLSADVLDRLDTQAEGLSADALRVVRAATARLLLVGVEDPLRPTSSVSGEAKSVAESGSPGLARSRPCSLDLVVELALEALDELGEGALGPLVVYLPEPSGPFEGRLLQAIARRADGQVLVGLTGIASVDQEHLDRLMGWGVHHRDAAVAEVPVPAARVLEVADPEEEVRAALREVSAQAESGVALPDMAVLYTTREPYANLLSDQLKSAELPWSGPGHRPLSASLAGRSLRRLLSLANRGLDRDAVVTLLSAAPIDDGAGSEAPAGLWDALSRQAGVIDGDHWVPRLAELADGLDERNQKAEVEKLAGFIQDLDAELAPPSDSTWWAYGRWARGLLERFLLLDGLAGSWPDEERLAFERVVEILDRLGDLDHLGVSPTKETVEATVLGELSGLSMPGQALGRGLYVGPLDSVPGLSFERVFVVGLTEGRFPRTPREDSLLPAQLRAAGRGMLAEASSLTDIDVRYVALATSASRRDALLLTARGDLRSTRSRSWPRLLDPLVNTYQSLDSHHQGLMNHGRPSSLLDLGLRSLVAHVNADDPVHTHPLAALDSVLAANLRRWSNRERPSLTNHDGRVPAGRFDPTERLLSPTALETYAACPRKYLFQRVLRLSEDDRPERIDQITPRDRGTLTHLILERFIAEALADDAVPAPDESWSTHRRGRLFELMDHEIEAARTKGITGGRVRTRLLRRQLYTELLNFLERDDELRADRGSTPVEVEYGFGLDHQTPALVGEWGGKQMQLRGSVDRVDFTADGGVMVIDYKGGSGRAFDKLEENPLQNGRRLQLPLYARAVAERLGRDGKRSGIYWLTKRDALREMVLDEALESEVEEAVGASLRGIELGLFPGVPGEVVGWPRLSFDNCKFCDFDRVCPTDRQSEWDRVRSDADLATVELLLGPLDDDRGGARDR